MALADIYLAIVKNEKLNVIGRPEVTITKLAPGNPVEFKIQTAVMPEITLPDYKNIASSVSVEKNAGDVSDKELNETLEQIKKGIAGQKKVGGKEADKESTLQPHYRYYM